LGEREDQEFPYFHLLSCPKPTGINFLDCALIFMRKTIRLISRNGGSIYFVDFLPGVSTVM
jgi:hypothetical protein